MSRFCSGEAEANTAVDYYKSNELLEFDTFYLHTRSKSVSSLSF